MGKFIKTETGIKGLVVIEPTVFEDNRGYFMETYSKRDFEELGIDTEFVQDSSASSEVPFMTSLSTSVKAQKPMVNGMASN